MSSTDMTIDGGCCCHGRPATSQPSVAVLPGNTAWMRMPLLVSSCCSERLKASTYALDAPYTPLSASTEMPAAEPMLLIVPQLRRRSCVAEASEGGDVE